MKTLRCWTSSNGSRKSSIELMLSAFIYRSNCTLSTSPEKDGREKKGRCQSMAL